MQATDTTPRVYVACLASYNAGRLHGEWIDATDADEMREGIAEMLKRSPVAGAEEYAIHDYDNFHGLALGEYEDLDHVAELAQALDAHGETFAVYANYVGPEYATLDSFEEAEAGEWESEEAFAQDLADATQPFAMDDPIADVLAAWPYSYIDWERATRDLFMGDYWSARLSNGNVAVFRAS